MTSFVRSLIFLHFGLLSVVYTFPQNIDSLHKVLQSSKEDSNKVKTLLSLSTSLLNDTKFDSALYHLKTSLNLSEKINFRKGTGRSYYYIATIYNEQFKYADALANTSLALKNFEGGEKKYVAYTYLLIAEIYNRQDTYADALKNYYAALKILEGTRDSANIIFTEVSIGNVYHNQKNYSDALKLYNEALRKSKELGDERLIAICYGSMGVLFYDQGKYEEALRSDSMTFEIFRKTGDRRGIAVLLLETGKIFEKQGHLEIENGNIPESEKKYNRALNNYHSALEIFEELNNDAWGLVNSYINLGSVNTRLERFAEARNYYKKCIELSRKTGNKFEQRDGYLGLSNLDSIQGDYRQAYNNYKVYILHRDSMANDDINKASLQAKLDYESEKRAAIAKAEQEKKEAKALITRNLQYSAIVVFLILAIFLFWNSLQKQKAKTKIEKAYSDLQATQAQLIQSEKMASLGELTAGIAHEIQNPLNFVNNFSEVNSELITEMKEEISKGNLDEARLIANDIEENEQKIMHHGKRADAIVKGMLQHSRSNTGQKESTDINALADEYLRLSYHGLRAKDKSFNATFQVDLDPGLSRLNIVPQDIGRVLLNLYNNAFFAVAEKKKESRNGYEPLVTVSTKKARDQVVIQIADNGNGVPNKFIDKIFQPFFTTKPTGQGTGLGLSLSYDIVKAHGGDIKVETDEGKGTVFIIELPYNRINAVVDHL